MQTTIKYINRLLRVSLCALLPAALVSCSLQRDIPDSPQPEEDDGINVSIQLTGQPGEQTRSEADEDGTIADNYINYKDLYVMTFSLEGSSDVLTGDSKLIEVMWHPDYAVTSYTGKSTVSSNGEDVYLTAQLAQNEPAYQNNNNFCIVAIANIGSFKKTLTTAQLTNGMKFSKLQEGLKLDFKPASGTEWNWCPDNTKGRGIPMFGVKKVNLRGYDSKIFSAWNPYELHSADGSKDLKLLRAFAKVVVKFKEEDFETPTGQKDVKFVTGGGIGKNYSGGFKVIPGLSRMENFNTLSETGQVIYAPGEDIISGTTAPSADLQFTASADGSYATLYLPEYKLSDNDADNPDLTVIIAFGGIPQSFTFKLKQYTPDEVTSPDHTDWGYLLRNHCYCFTIGIEYGKLSVVATDWDNSYDNVFDF